MRDHELVAANFRANGYPPPHRLATLLPDYDLKSISGAREVAVPVVTRKQTGEMVDGVNRAERLIECGVLWAAVPKIEVDLPTDEDVAAHIHKLNLERRHLTASQAAVATVLLGLGEPHQGARTDLRQNCRKSSPVSAKYLQYARTACDPERAAPELATGRDGWRGHGPGSGRNRQRAAQGGAGQGVPRFACRQPIVQDPGGQRSDQGAQRQTIDRVAADRTVSRDLRRSGWAFDGESPFNHRAVTGKYAVISIEDICALPVKDIAARDGWLAMWVTIKHRQRAVAEVVPAWGFEFIDEIIWRKNVPGLGRIVHHMHEVLLICRRGNPQLPPTDAI